MKKRYPGPLPFSYDDRPLFFGREQERDYLTTLISINRVTVLHGKSGYGKSSLINAGLIPTLLERFNCEIIRVQFYKFDKNNPLRPLETFLKTIEQHLSGTPYLDGLLTDTHQSAWRYFKKLQYEVLKKFPKDAEAAAIASQLSYVIVIDQFEELFTHPKEAVLELAKEFQEILLNVIPEEYQEGLKEGFRNAENLEAHKEELSILDKDIPLKMVFSLRSERFNYLTYLVNYIPSLLNNTYKVRRMTPSQVREAITRPALAEGDGFDSPRFTYDSDVVEKLIDFLNAGTSGEAGKIEVFEMQIVCQKLEELLIQHLALYPPAAGELPLFTEKIISESDTIKDKQQPFAEIMKNYYKECIDLVTEPVEQLAARYLIEFKLIDSLTNNRVSLDNAFVRKTGISKKVLDHLIDKHIIRIEVNTVSGHSYEISHDSLIVPIRKAATELGDLGKQLNAFYERAVNTVSESGRSVRDIINTILLEESEEKKAAATELSAEDFALLRTSPVITLKDDTEGTNNIEAFGIKKIFQQTAQQVRVKAQQSSTKSWVRRFTIASATLIGVIILFISYRITERRKDSRQNALTFLSSINTVPNKKEALILTEYLFHKKILTGSDSFLFKDKLTSLLHEPDVQALFSFYDTSFGKANLDHQEIELSQNGNLIVNANTDEQHRYTYHVLQPTGKKPRQFDNILYGYFIDHANIAVLGKLSEGADSLYSKGGKFANSFILFDCANDTSQTIFLEPGYYLYPPYYNIPSRLNDFDSYRIQKTASGNFIIPIYTTNVSSEAMQRVKLIGPGLNKLLYSVGSISTSKDGKKFMTVQRTREGTTEMVIYDEQGNRLNETFPGYEFSDFTANGSLLLSGGGTLTIHDSTGHDQSFILNDAVVYAYANGDGKTAVVEGENALYTIDVSSGKKTVYRDQLMGVNFSKHVFFCQSKPRDNGPDTIWRRAFFNNGSGASFVCPEGIQSGVYSEKHDALLVYTNNNRLYLLDSLLHIRAGFQLTANDLYGFYENGDRFFYMRNEVLNFFKNDKSLVNLFDMNQSIQWLKHFDTTSKATLQSLKTKYDLQF